jgi:hypothetical protein
MANSSAPHHTFACRLKSTTVGLEGGRNNCQIPAGKISAPFVASEMPMKNQIEIETLSVTNSP